jgi:hypothetical protein
MAGTNRNISQQTETGTVWPSLTFRKKEAIVEHFGDHDGKSKTSSAVDAEHYPDGGEQENIEDANRPSYAEIAAVAHRIWEQRGRPSDSHEQDWLEAERQLRAGGKTPKDSRILAEQSGSVQR